MEKINFNNLNRETYNRIASLFHATRSYLWDDILVFKKYLHDNMAILDVGCGTGRLYQLFKDFQGVEYTGLDSSEEQIKMAKNDFPKNNYVLGEMTMLPFEKSKFDFVFCIATLHHLSTREDRVKALQETKRVLKTGGYLFLNNWNLYSKSAQKTVEKGKWSQKEIGNFIVPWFNPKGEKIGERYYYGFEIEELRLLLEEVGFSVVENYYSKKGKKVGVEDGANIVTVAKI